MNDARPARQKQIWKERLIPGGVALPKGSKPVHVNDWHVWFEFEEVTAAFGPVVYVVGTGHTIPSSWTYVGTFHDRDGHHVWHVYSDEVVYS